MKVEISKEQKEALGKKIALCVDFLKKEVQPHLIPSDKIEIGMGDVLDLYITSKSIYVTKTRVINLFIIDFPIRRTLFLEKNDRKQAKKYICDVFPELAVDFLKNWEKAKIKLMKDVFDKTEEIKKLDQFVDSFKL